MKKFGIFCILWAMISCKTTGRQVPDVSEVQSIEPIAGSVSPDKKNASIKLSWPCNGNKRPNPNTDSKGVPFRGITQEEYCEWYFVPGKEYRTENLEELKCTYTNSFDASRSYWLPNRAPQKSRYWDIIALRDVTFRGKKIGMVTGEEEDFNHYMGRIPDDSRRRWDTQFNTYAALNRLVADCSPKGVKCEDVACVADRASDPLVCSGVQTLVNENQCLISLPDYSKLQGDQKRDFITADPAFLETRRRHAKRDLMQEIVFKMEWHLQASGAIQANQRLPEHFWQLIGDELERLQVKTAQEKLPFFTYSAQREEYLASIKGSTPLTLTAEEEEAFKTIAMNEWNGELENNRRTNYERFNADTAFKLQLEIKPGVAEFCQYKVEKKLQKDHPEAQPDHTLVECVIPEGVPGTDTVEIRSCDELAQYIMVAARVDARDCRKSLCNILGCTDPDTTGSGISRGQGRAVDVRGAATRDSQRGLGGRSGRL